jgi:putative nucleotidyltransferase with HDIG domain
VDKRLVKAFVGIIELRDAYTFRHSKNVTKYSLQLGKALKLDDKTINNLKFAGLLHDIGKIAVPDAILRKPTPLTEDEFIEIKRHSIVGANALKESNFNNKVILGVRHHHEFFDGGGYPDGLKGESIPLIARVITVADAFDAMISQRPYRKAFSCKEALKELKACAGSQFDPKFIDVFIKLFKENELKL